MDWFKKHWKPVVGAIVLILLLLAAYGTGRYMTPPKVVEKEKIVTKTEVQTQVKYQDRVVEKLVYVKDEHRNVHTVTTDTTKPDGTKEHKVETTDLTQNDTHVTDGKAEVKTEVKTEVKYVDRVVEKEKIVTAAKPQWRLGAMVGVDVMTAIGSHSQPIPQLGPVVIGVEAERRIAGPFSIGLWATTSAQVGVLANIEF